MLASRKLVRRLKKIMGVFCIPVAAVSLSCQVSYAARTWVDKENGNNLTFLLDEESLVLTISGSGEITGNTFLRLRVPGYVVNRVVIARGGNILLRNCCFSSFNRMKSVEMSNSVKEIGECVFYGCEGLENVVIPDSVKKIGKGAFLWCNSLRSVVISKSVKEIGAGAFKFCVSLESVKFGNDERGKDIDSLKALDLRSRELIDKKKLGKAFYGNLKVNESGTLSSYLKEFLYKRDEIIIGVNAFAGCKSLKYLDTNGRVLNCHEAAFCGTPVFHNLRGKVMCGEYHYLCPQDVVAKMFSLDSINDRFNKDGDRLNPANCPSRYLFWGKVMCGKYHYTCHQEMMAKMFLLDSINDRFNKDGGRINPADRPLRYPFSNPGVGVRNIAQ